MLGCFIVSDISSKHNILKTVYSAFIVPHLFYCNIVWGCANVIKLNIILKLQKKALRLCTGSHYLAPSAPIFHRLNMLTIVDIHKFQTANFMYRVKNEIVPSNLMCMFSSNNLIHNYNTRSAGQFHRWRIRTELENHSIRHAGPKIWNELGSKICNCTTISAFKILLKKEIISSYA